MNPETIHRLKGFAGTLDGELSLGIVSRVAYSTDASMYQIIPDAVLIPGSYKDLKRIVEFCRSERVALIPRGAGTNMTGSALGKGVICDLSKYLNAVIELNAEADYCRVESGMVHGYLQGELERSGKFFPPDPSSGDYCTIGGVAANNSSGIHAVKYGDAKEWISDINVILSGGHEISTENLNGKENLHLLNTSNLKSFEDLISFKVYRLISENLEILKRARPHTSKNSSGYNLFEAYRGDRLDWNKIFVGSEGTLGVFKSVKLKITDLPKHKMLFLCSFRSLEDSLKLLEGIVALKPSGCELLDDILIGLIMKENKGIAKFLPEGCGSVLLVEFDGMNEGDVEKSSSSFKSLISSLAIRIDEATTKEEQEFLWSIRKASSPILNRIEGIEKPVRFIEDLAVSPSRLLDFIRDLKGLMREHGVGSAIYGHVGAGNIHVNPNINTGDAKYKQKLRDLSAKTYELIRSYGGSIAGEHGDGLLRAPFVNVQEGRLSDIYRKLKAILDPSGIMNPGKKISSETALKVDSLRYDYEENLSQELSKCHGCGTCRHYCPVANTTKDEKDSARSKINLLKMVASGTIPQDEDTLKEVLGVIDHCVNCGQCLVSCPTVIDVPLLCIEAKRVLRERFGSTIAQRYLGDVQPIVRSAAEFAPLANISMKIPAVRGLMEMAAGIDRRREMPSFKRAKLNKSPGKIAGHGEKVIYHPGCYALYNDPDEAEGTLKVLNALGIEPIIHDLDSCYVSSMSQGTYGTYESRIDRNLKFIRNYTDEGYKLITSSASCGLAYKVEYPSIFKWENAKAISRNTYDIHEYLEMLQEKGLLKLNLKESKLKVAFHAPCHLRAQKGKFDPVRILNIIPGLHIKKLEGNCCGIAGTFGMKKENFDLSMKIGQRLFDEINESGADMIVTCCGTCKMQIEQGTGMKVVHSMALLADSINSG